MRVFGARSRYSRVMLLLLGVTVAASVALCVLAWRLALVDAALRDQLASDRLEQAADLARSSLLQHIARTGESLRLALEAPSGAQAAHLSELAETTREGTTVLLDGASWKLFPDRRLRYLPDSGRPFATNDGVFAEGEALEHRQGNYAEAARWFRELASRSEGPLRAGALLRAARNEVKRQEPARARLLYEELAELGAVSLDGEPAALVAKYARLRLLDPDARMSAARELSQDLEAGRWLLSRASYRYYRDELARIAPSPSDEPLWEEAIGAVAVFSRQSDSGERVVWVDPAQPLLVIWRSRAGITAAVALTGDQLVRWLAASPGFASRLGTAGGQTLAQGQAGPRHSERVLSFAGQDWRLLTTATSPIVQRGTQSLLWVGLVLLVVLVVTGSYAVVRAVSREFAVAIPRIHGCSSA